MKIREKVTWLIPLTAATCHNQSQYPSNIIPPSISLKLTLDLPSSPSSLFPVKSFLLRPIPSTNSLCLIVGILMQFAAATATKGTHLATRGGALYGLQ